MAVPPRGREGPAPGSRGRARSSSTRTRAKGEAKGEGSVRLGESSGCGPTEVARTVPRAPRSVAKPHNPFGRGPGGSLAHSSPRPQKHGYAPQSVWPRARRELGAQFPAPPEAGLRPTIRLAAGPEGAWRTVPRAPRSGASPHNPPPTPRPSAAGRWGLIAQFPAPLKTSPRPAPVSPPDARGQGRRRMPHPPRPPVPHHAPCPAFKDEVGGDALPTPVHTSSPSGVEGELGGRCPPPRPTSLSPSGV